jgi:hypothetical protein
MAKWQNGRTLMNPTLISLHYHLVVVLFTCIYNAYGYIIPKPTLMRHYQLNNMNDDTINSIWCRLRVQPKKESDVISKIQRMCRNTKWTFGDIKIWQNLKPQLSFKSKRLVTSWVPASPGMLYLKTCLDKQLIEAIEELEYVKFFYKTDNRIDSVNDYDSEQLDIMTTQGTNNNVTEYDLWRGGSIRVINGIHEGTYGVLSKITRNQMLEVSTQ